MATVTVHMIGREFDFVAGLPQKIPRMIAPTKAIVVYAATTLRLLPKVMGRSLVRAGRRCNAQRNGAFPGKKVSHAAASAPCG
ncbi:hypothetical protein [Afipia sp. Root123D2]|uniref:hypothetical protein n=1 Tax=Afipia sp. Root123D2 TaxID=1736436 RepID=UPI00138F10CC|nr:hypothetical protein [Afipia sp. Root123D2]